LKVEVVGDDPELICETTVQGFFLNEGSLENGVWTITNVNIPPDQTCIYTVALSGDLTEDNGGLLNQSVITGFKPNETLNISLSNNSSNSLGSLSCLFR